MNGVPPHESVRLHPGETTLLQACCRACGRNLGGVKTEPYFEDRSILSEGSFMPIVTICPDCRASNPYCGPLSLGEPAIIELLTACSRCGAEFERFSVHVWAETEAHGRVALSKRTTCPQCDQDLYYNGPAKPPRELTLWTHHKCGQCGYDLCGLTAKTVGVVCSDNSITVASAATCPECGGRNVLLPMQYRTEPD